MQFSTDAAQKPFVKLCNSYGRSLDATFQGNVLFQHDLSVAHSCYQVFALLLNEYTSALDDAKDTGHDQ